MEAVAVVLFVLGIGLSLLTTGNAQQHFDVGKFGAVGDGKTDDSKAFLKAWQAVCGAEGETATLEISAQKTYLLSSLEFHGPCKAKTIHVQVLGNILAPSADAWSKSKSGNYWICIRGVDGLIVDGPGTIDGNGATWWGKHSTSERPTALYFDSCNNLRLSGFTHLNSQRNHITVYNCRGVSISKLHIIAPSDSPNTDGINIGMSSQLFISDTFIGTGDDCIALSNGTSNINITNVTCGPGHGISIGSLGGADDRVEQVYATGCTFNASKNGVRIKTIPGGTGFVRDVKFVGIKLIASGNPILIDQHYCNGMDHHCQDQEKSLAISDVTFRGFRGTSSVIEAINLDCSKQGCRGITIDNVNIRSSVGKKLQAVCNNAHGTASSTIPVVSCLSS